MAQLICLKTFTDKRGNLTVIEDFDIPFTIKRIFYIYGVDNSVRGKHRHRSTTQALICLKGSCTIYNNDGSGNIDHFILSNPSQCLIINPNDWHKMFEFSADCILQVFASTNFDPNDYIYEGYPKND